MVPSWGLETSSPWREPSGEEYVPAPSRQMFQPLSCLVKCQEDSFPTNRFYLDTSVMSSSSLKSRGEVSVAE